MSLRRMAAPRALACKRRSGVCTMTLSFRFSRSSRRRMRVQRLAQYVHRAAQQGDCRCLVERSGTRARSVETAALSVKRFPWLQESQPEFIPMNASNDESDSVDIVVGIVRPHPTVTAVSQTRPFHLRRAELPNHLGLDEAQRQWAKHPRIARPRKIVAYDITVSFRNLRAICQLTSLVHSPSMSDKPESTAPTCPASLSAQYRPAWRRLA